MNKIKTFIRLHKNIIMNSYVGIKCFIKDVKKLDFTMIILDLGIITIISSLILCCVLYPSCIPFIWMMFLMSPLSIDNERV